MHSGDGAAAPRAVLLDRSHDDTPAFLPDLRRVSRDVPAAFLLYVRNARAIDPVVDAADTKVQQPYIV